MIETRMVENGQEAIRALEEAHDYDMIIMDTRMPIMDGFEATRYIRKQLNLKIPILSLSATVMAEDIREALQSGMNDTLSKPFQPIKLHEKIRDLMQSLF